MAGNGSPIRFAALVRVSTEQQEKTGESLRTQRTQIEDAVKQLGGHVVEWYGGQEHATPGWEKKEIERLLADASKGALRFDAVMVAHADRWSRDNKGSQAGLDLLKKKQIHFFTLTQEHDLFDPTAEMFLGMSAVIGGYQAKLQRKKSLESRIHRAKRGLPTCGKLPYGRTFDKKTGQWGIDPKKQRIMEDVARRYLAGEAMPKLAEELGVNHTSLHKTLTRRCGDTWTQEFGSEELNIHDTVKVSIPRLLPEGAIKAILTKVAANKTYAHGKIKYRYLLSRMVFCEKCGYAMFGQTNRGKHRYYRHVHTKRLRACGSSKGWAPADALEDAVLRHLFNTFGNPAAVEQAIERAMPDLDAMRQLQARVVLLDGLIEDERKGKQKVVRLVMRGVTTENEAGEILKESEQRISQMQQERDRLSGTMMHVPTADQVRDTAKHVASRFKYVPPALVRANAVIGSANSHFSQMTWDDRRDLLQRVFAGKTLDGQRAGVYIEWPEGKGGKCRYTINGLLTRTDSLPMPADEAKSLVDPECVRAERQDEVLTKCASRSPAPIPPARRSWRRRAAPAA